MKPPIFFFRLKLCLSIFVISVHGTPSLSLKLEIERSLDKGLAWLHGQQNSDSGYWGNEDYPALTALALRATMGHPVMQAREKYSTAMSDGFAFLRTKVQSDGGIYGKGLASYNTSLCLLAFLQQKNPADFEIIDSARKFIVNQQSDFDRKGISDNLFDGGIGYGSTWAHSDLSNTHLAMEALYYAKKIMDGKEGHVIDLDWEAAIGFVSKCQNLPAENKQEWVSEHPEDRGGFVYFPGKSMAGERNAEGGKVSLRSYGSMSYAGLLSFIYAEMDPSDERVATVNQWLSENYSIEENPGMGLEGLYYYYHTMAKALSLSGVDYLPGPDGKRINWKKDLSVRLFDNQNQDGYWVNDSGRWWEKDPVLVTCYAMLALERIYHAL